MIYALVGVIVVGGAILFWPQLLEALVSRTPRLPERVRHPLGRGLLRLWSRMGRLHAILHHWLDGDLS